MALFLDSHLATALSADGVTGSGPDAAKDVGATFRQVYSDTYSGFNTALHEAHSAPMDEQKFEPAGSPFDAIDEVDCALITPELTQMLARG